MGKRSLRITDGLKFHGSSIVDAALRMAVGNRGQGCPEIGEGLDAVDLTGFDQRCDAAPGAAAFVMAVNGGVKTGH